MMKYVNLTSCIYYSDTLDALSISKSDEFLVYIEDRCLNVHITNSITLNDLMNIEGFRKISEGDIPIGTWVLSAPTVINRLELVPKYEYIGKTVSCYIQEKVNSILDYDGNIYIVVKSGIGRDEYVDLLNEFFYVINPNVFMYPVNFTGFILNSSIYRTNDRYVFVDNDYMLIDVWNYVYDYQDKLSTQFDFLQVYQYDRDFDDNKYEHLKMIDASYTQFEGQDGPITQMWRDVDLYTTKQILNIKTTFQYQCIDRRVFDARVTDFYQSKFLTNIRSGVLEDLPTGVDRNLIDVSYSCTPSEIRDISIVDQSTETATERHLYTFNFEVVFICPVYRRLKNMPKILEIVYRLHEKYSKAE